MGLGCHFVRSLRCVGFVWGSLFFHLWFLNRFLPSLCKLFFFMIPENFFGCFQRITAGKFPSRTHLACYSMYNSVGTSSIQYLSLSSLSQQLMQSHSGVRPSIIECRARRHGVHIGCCFLGFFFIVLLCVQTHCSCSSDRGYGHP